MTDSTVPAPITGGGVPGVPGYDTGTSAAGTPATGASQVQGEQVTIGSFILNLNNGVKSTDLVQSGMQSGYTTSAGGPRYDTVANILGQFNGWGTTQLRQFALQAYQAGLVTSKNAPKSELVVAWQTVVEEAAKDKIDPQTLIQKAVDSGGWNNIQPAIMPGDNGLPGTGNANNLPDQSQSSTQTIYTSYLDPATIQGAQADAWFRLLGMNPTSEDYQNFLKTVYGYQQAENTGKFENKTTSKTADNSGTGAAGGGATGGTDTNTVTNEISQRQIGQRGLQFLAGQAAMQNPEYGTYQAATTYFHALMSALSAPGAGMQASGPTAMAP